MIFFKYQGTGNDFVMVDNRTNEIKLSQPEIEKLCHRRFGIGADGLIMLENAEGFDFRMVYYNADGNEGSMCGNGGRCTVRFAHDLGIFQEKTSFIAVDGPHEATVSANEISLKMMDVEQISENEEFTFMNTGSPHYISFVEDLETYDVVGEGKKIRYSDEWVKKGGTNVNFVEQKDEKTLFVRTYERGVEDETYSCGTGVTACAIASALRLGMKPPISVKTLGGNLQVSFKGTAENGFTEVFLTGPALCVFQGNVDLK